MVKKGAALIFDSAPPAAYNRGHESGPAGFWGPEPAFPLPLWRGSAAAVARWAPNFNRRGKIQVKHMNTKQNAAKRILSRAWGKAPVKRLTALLVMLAVTIGSVTTVMASVKPVSVTYNGEVYSGNTTASIETVEDARAQLLSMGLAVHDDDAVTLSSGEEGEPVITLVSAHKVSVLADGMLKETTVYEGDPISKALGQCGVVVDANDILSAPVTTSVTADTVFEVERRYEVTITADGKTKKLLTGDGTVGELLEEEGIEVGADDKTAANFRKGGADAVVFASPSAVESFVKNAKNLLLDDGAVRPKIFSVGPTTTAALKKYAMNPYMEGGDVAGLLLAYLGIKG